MKKFCNLPNRVIAITGPIASGKSTYCRELEEQGAAVFYVDKIIKRIYGYKSVHRALADLVDPSERYCLWYDLYNGKIDFKRLRTVLFAEPELLTKFEEIINPHFEGEFLKEYMERKLYEPVVEVYCSRDEICNSEDCDLMYPDIHIEHPLVYQMNIQNQFDDIVMLTVDEETQIKRIIMRDGCSEETAKQMIERQRG